MDKSTSKLSFCVDWKNDEVKRWLLAFMDYFHFKFDDTTKELITNMSPISNAPFLYFTTEDQLSKFLEKVLVDSSVRRDFAQKLVSTIKSHAYGTIFCCNKYLCLF